MTPTEREQKARAFWRKCAGDLPVKDAVIERTVKLIAETERATLERVADEMWRHPYWGKEAEVWIKHLRQQAKERA